MEKKVISARIEFEIYQKILSISKKRKNSLSDTVNILLKKVTLNKNELEDDQDKERRIILEILTLVREFIDNQPNGQLIYDQAINKAKEILKENNWK